MSKYMLIDAAHAEETRVAVVDGHRLEEFDFESRSKRQLRGNIYLAKVTRVEPSLQAAFIEYGGNRHGFLAFNEIHPDYFQIPVADRQAIMAEPDTDDDIDHEHDDDDDEGMSAEEAKLRRRLMRRYKIQEVIKRRQILLVQVVKEERGTKGAALTTYMSLAGRYCVLMPNTARGGGISRKITNATDRKRLKSAAASLDVPQGMGLIIRTAGAKRTKQEIKRDYEYLLRLWENIRETTLKSNAPALIYEEEDLVKRAIRDMYDKDVDAIYVDGEEGFREAREFMRMIMPSQAKKIERNPDPTPLFVKHRVEEVLAAIHSPTVPLKSGGYLVINQTEALVAIDVNSGRATKERNIEATALKTNMEAAEEAARQLRLRDLAGLIVIDFIDMDEGKNNRAVEKKLKDALADDRARIQMGKISSFGLMEISRQRRRSGILEGTTHVCEHCQGAGRVRSVESSALQALRSIEMEAVRGGAGAATLRVPQEVALYVLNEKRQFLSEFYDTSGLFVTVLVDDTLARDACQIERTETGERLPAAAPLVARGGARYIDTPIDDSDDGLIEDEEDEEEIEDEDEEAEAAEVSEGSPTARGPRGERDGDREGGRDGGRDGGRGGRRRRRRRGGREDGLEAREGAAEDLDAEGDEEDADGETSARDDRDDDGSEGARRRRRRGRRGGRRVREDDRGRDPYAWVRGRTPSLDDPYVWFDPIALTTQAHAERAQERPESERAERAERPERAERAPRPEGSEERLGREGREGRGRGRRRRGGRDRGERGEAAEANGFETEVIDAIDPVAEAPAESVEAIETVEAPVAAPVIEEAAPKRRRVRAKKADAAAEAAPAEEPAAAEEPVVEAVVEPEPAPEVQAEPEPEAVPAPAPVAETAVPVTPEPEPVLAEPDPAEILAPPAKPKRGWWRRG